jgi:hypothetical protein
LKYAAEMGSVGMIYIPSFIKIGLGIRAILKGYYLDNIRSCSVGITDGKDL